MRIAILTGAVLCAGCWRSGPPPEPAPAPTPAPAARRQTLIVSDPRTHTLRACVIQNGELTEVRFEYDIYTGDSVYRGMPFTQAFPAGAGYAATARWYVENLPIAYRPGPSYIKYGLPRTLRPDQVTRIGEYDGVGVYGEAGWTGFHDVLYLPVRPGCWFQPYVVLATK